MLHSFLPQVNNNFYALLGVHRDQHERPLKFLLLEPHVYFEVDCRIPICLLLENPFVLLGVFIRVRVDMI